MESPNRMIWPKGPLLEILVFIFGVTFPDLLSRVALSRMHQSTCKYIANIGLPM